MTVLVLNATYEPINVCTVKRAVVLLLKEKAEILEFSERELHSESRTLRSPAVIRLLLYVKIPYGARKRITRSAVFARDEWRCQYCGANSTLTVDHVIPRSRGGDHAWDNIVTCCSPCNHKKNDRLPREAGMKLRHAPRVPRRDVFVYIYMKAPPITWQRYLVS